MSILALDLGGTKLASAVFTSEGTLMERRTIQLLKRSGKEVASLLVTEASALMAKSNVEAIGISVPGISRKNAGTVWAPNIAKWNDYPLLQEMQNAFPSQRITIESDRSCSVMGEYWKGNARGLRDVIFLAVGTGIGAGIMVNGSVVRGAGDIAGAVGWMALPQSTVSGNHAYGFEVYASGPGIASLSRAILNADSAPSLLRNYREEDLEAQDVFDSFASGDQIAARVLKECVVYWGIASANLISIFNPQKIIFGGGVFGPALQFLPEIRDEAAKWAQPISMKQVTLEPSALENDAALYGAAYFGSTSNNGPGR
jgi:glucokinase